MINVCGIDSTGKYYNASIRYGRVRFVHLVRLTVKVLKDIMEALVLADLIDNCPHAVC